MKNLLCAWCVLCFASTLQAQSVEAVLARMDQAAPSFRTMSANVDMVEFLALLKSKTSQTGTLEMQRLKPGQVRAILDFTGGDADPRTIGFLGKKVTIYYPKLNAYQDFPVGNNSDVVNQYLLLGFGSSGRELAKSYTIRYLGQENVAGESTSELELDPKDATVQQKLKKVLMWIPDNGANPVQQQFFQPDGNYRKLTYTGINLKPSMKVPLELHLPPGARKQA